MILLIYLNIIGLYMENNLLVKNAKHFKDSIIYAITSTTKDTSTIFSKVLSKQFDAELAYRVGSVALKTLALWDLVASAIVIGICLSPFSISVVPVAYKAPILIYRVFSIFNSIDLIQINRNISFYVQGLIKVSKIGDQIKETTKSVAGLGINVFTIVNNFFSYFSLTKKMDAEEIKEEFNNAIDTTHDQVVKTFNTALVETAKAVYNDPDKRKIVINQVLHSTYILEIAKGIRFIYLKMKTV